MTTIVADRVDATVVDAALERNPYFSWGAALAGAAAATAVTALLIALGAGFGLVFMGPVTGLEAPKTALTAAAIYFFAAQAFGFAVGGFLAGRLCGPVLQSKDEEVFRSGAHGLVVWAVSAIAGALILIFSALAAAGAAGGIASAFGPSHLSGTGRASSATPADYYVDMLFRTPALSASRKADADARAEAGRILTVNAAKPGPMDRADHDELGRLVSEQTGLARTDADHQVDAVLNRAQADATRAAEIARKAAMYASIWTALALFFGLLVATGAAILARMEDEKRA